MIEQAATASGFLLLQTNCLTLECARDYKSACRPVGLDFAAPERHVSAQLHSPVGIGASHFLSEDRNTRRVFEMRVELSLRLLLGLGLSGD